MKPERKNEIINININIKEEEDEESIDTIDEDYQIINRIINKGEMKQKKNIIYFY